MAARNRSAKEWSRLVKRWEQSGKSCKQFAASEGVSWSTLSWWKWRLRSKPRPPASRKKPVKKPRPPAAVRMVEVVPATVPHRDASVELVLSEDVVIRVRRGFDAETLRQVVAVFACPDEPAC